MTTRHVDDRLTSWLTGNALGQPIAPLPVRTAVEVPFLRAWAGPAALIGLTPFLAVGLVMAVHHHQGSLWALLAAGPSTWLAEAPRPTLAALAGIVGWTTFQGLLLQLLPGPTFLGPVTPAGERPAYRLNGMAAWGITHAAVLGAWWAGLYSADAIYRHYGEIVITLNIGALMFCAFLAWKGRNYPTGRDTVITGLPLLDFFQGPELHPRLFGIQLKQLINCRVSMMGWSALWIVFALAQHERTGSISTGMVASTLVLVAYLFKFFWWEDGYFGSIDIIHDRFGYYIAWGVLVWVPAVYLAPALWQVEHRGDLHPAVAAAIVLFGLLSIAVNYDADAQRQRVRASNGEAPLWGKAPDIIRARWTAGDGVQRESILLASGWWGVARHFHYVPELALAFAWTVPAGFTHFIPWFYWIFLLILLADRARRDELKCAAKYGDAWRLYTQKVPWRMVPGIY